MGQAKLRGSYEQRKKEAELREAKERMARAAIESIRPKSKSQINLMIATSIAMAAKIRTPNDHT